MGSYDEIAAWTNEMSTSLSTEALEEALTARERFVAECRPQLSRAEQEIRLIRQLLSLRNGRADDEDRLTVTIATTGQGSPLSRSRHPVVDDVAHLLEAEGHPLHISEIMRLLGEQKASLPGKGDQANVIAHIRRDPRFVRPSRGVYALAAWGLRGSLERGDDGPRRRVKKRVKGTGGSQRGD